MILINFKIYKETWGEEAIKLANIIKEVADKHKVRIVIAASALDAVRIREKTGTEVWLQNIDEYSEGKVTGWISPYQAMDLGIKGSLLNHSEHKIPKGKVLKIVKNRPKEFEIMVCAHSVGQIEWIVKANPDWILYEPPELIASKEKSVATEKPEVIGHVAEKCGNVSLIVGAGIKDREDVEVSLKMGAKGVGLASAFVLGSEPKKILEELAVGFSCYNQR